MEEFAEEIVWDWTDANYFAAVEDIKQGFEKWSNSVIATSFGVATSYVKFAHLKKKNIFVISDF